MNQQITPYILNGEKILITTFAGYNRSSEVLNWHRKVFKHYNIPDNCILAPFEQGINYGWLINNYVNQLLDYADYFLFFDMDAIPLKKTSIEWIIEKIKDKSTIWGISQQSTHILKNGTCIHPYAGFSSCGFSKELYIKIGKPSFCENHRGDIGEELTWRVKELGYNICLSYPSEWHELTDKEMADTGNFRFGLVDNGIKMGIGTTFGGQFYHSFHEAVIPGTHKVAIPRSVELFIEKARTAMGENDFLNQYKRKNRKLEMISVCVDSDSTKFSKFLEITLPLNKKHFDNVLIVTTDKDKEVKRICHENNINFYCTDEFYANNSRFDANRAINSALHLLKYKDWIISTSPDMVYPENFRDKLKLHNLDEDNMYGTSRAFIPTYDDWTELRDGKKKITDFEIIPGWGCGFCQIFSLNSIKLKNIPLNETLPSNGQSVESDIWFLKRFHPDVRLVGKLDIDLIHLGHKDSGGQVRGDNNIKIPQFFQ